MSTFHNNNTLHNLRMGVRMHQAGMPASVVEAAFKDKNILFPAALVTAASEPGVLESLGERPITHAVAEQHIDIYTKVFVPFAEQLQGAQATQNQEDVDEHVVTVFISEEDGE